MIVNQVEQLIGNTPLFEFAAEDFGGYYGTKIYAKLEYLNPGGSIKDRLGEYLLKAAMKAGKVQSGTTIIEPTAGNTGIGLALAAVPLGLKVMVVVPEKFSLEKQQLMTALGAKIVHTKTEDGIIGAIAKAQELAKEIKNSYIPLQFENFDNPAAYYQTLGPEIFSELAGELTSFVAGIGSGGSFAGTGKFLQENSMNLRLIGVEPEGSILNGGPAGSHEIEGIGVEFVPPFLAELPVNEIYTISDLTGFTYTRMLAKNYGLLVGSSSGAALAAAIEESKKLPAGSKIVTIFPDAGDRYLSKNIYSPTLFD
ncbi:PLP-dependent cysteine synthase family protein [Enterococcus alishanensis]|uniref:Cysteine synthase family protein n=1 Tax=Enterococcus alishanensis TaxID=1303817 RepID=A0ABS6TEA9_9ENTE|nr:cysteine synthase family protein [Enterococcus alishanensis]MBV7391263.1 cysteine synthase family protein [Enterococcus alishanensis]